MLTTRTSIFNRLTLLLSGTVLVFGTSACFFDPVSEALAIPAREACYEERDCKNATSTCITYNMVLYDELFDCNLLGNNPGGETGGFYCDPLLLAWDCSFAVESCIAGCNADPG